jgi:hypothetical protein
MEFNGQAHASVALPPKRNTGTDWIGGRVGTRANMEVLEKWKIANPYRNSKLRMFQSMAQSLQQLPYVLQAVTLPFSIQKHFHYHGNPPIRYSNSYICFGIKTDLFLFNYDASWKGTFPSSPQASNHFDLNRNPISRNNIKKIRENYFNLSIVVHHILQRTHVPN